MRISFAKMFEDPDYVTRPELYLAFQSRIRGVMDERYKLVEYRTEDLKLTQLFDLKNDPWERNNFYDIAGYEEITARLRQRLFELRDEWEDESTIFGQQYWQQWRQYDEAAVRGVSALIPSIWSGSCCWSWAHRIIWWDIPTWCRPSC